MSLINWIFDIYQHHKLDQATTETGDLRNELRAMKSQGGGLESAQVRRAVGELALAVKTLQRVMVEKGVCTEQEFQTRLQQIDGEDGLADGQAPL